MNDLHTAFFVFNPSRLDDLTHLHPIDVRKPYVIVKTIELPRIDYENFITDLCVSREFIEENAELCRIDGDGVWHCMLIRQTDRRDGVLVMPDGRGLPQAGGVLGRC